MLKIKKIGQFKYLCFGDVHFGHANNKTLDIIDALLTMFSINVEEFKTLDAIFINGDLFEKLLTLNSEEYVMVTKWFRGLLRFCLKNNIALRLLEGTPSHDLEQGKIFKEGMGDIGLDVDFKYIKSISIEYMEKHDKYILYIPDENDLPADERFKVVKSIMKEMGISKVDYTMMHGHFRYQLPIILPSAHSEEDYLSITRYYIHTNHIHTFSVFERIIATGSFDRLKHSEEEDKGAVMGMLRDGECSFVFIKNKQAKIFKTFKLTEDPSQDELDSLHVELKKLPSTAFVRIISPSNSLTSSELANMYDFDEVKVTVKEDKLSEIHKIIALDEVPEVDTETVEIKKTNIVKLLTEELDGSLNKNGLRIMEEELAMITPSVSKLHSA